MSTDKRVGIFVDTETSGVDEKLHSVLQVALIAYDLDSKQTLGTYSTFVNHPTVNVQLAALKVNNIDLRTLSTLGISPSDTCDKISEFVRTYGQGQLVTPIGHNVDFDLRFLKVLFEANKRRYPFAFRTLDTCSTARFLIEAKLLPPTPCKLGDLVQLFQIPSDPTKLHGAIYDVELTVKVFEKLLAVAQVGQPVRSNV